MDPQDTRGLHDPEYLVALVAAILGGGAFIVAVLQALLQYLNSNNARWKCTKSAIGYANKHIRTTWSFASWKIKVFYPLLDFESNRIIEQMMLQRSKGVDYHGYIIPIFEKFEAQGSYWAQIESGETLNWRHIA